LGFAARQKPVRAKRGVHFTVIKFKRAVGKNLIILVAFSASSTMSPLRLRPWHAIAFSRSGSIRYFQRFSAAHDDVADDFQRVFAARIVAGKNRQALNRPVTSPSQDAWCGLSPPQPKKRDDAALDSIRALCESGFQRVVGMR